MQIYKFQTILHNQTNSKNQRRKFIIFTQELQTRIQFLKETIKEKEQALAAMPPGSVNIYLSDGRIRYYLNANGKRTYLNESSQLLTQKLCQKDYDQKILKAAQAELNALEKLNLFYQDTDHKACETVYENLPVERRKFVQPVWLPDEEYVKQWESVTYKKKEFHQDAPEFYTEKGERVRSKTEILIANALKSQNVPYRYECPLVLEGYGLIHPDFTVLNVRTRREIYFEHLGMIDNEDYREDAFKRILAYEKNDIFPGDRLVLTHETQKNPINSRIIEKIINKYFK